jgi:hypothetical protein
MIVKTLDGYYWNSLRFLKQEAQRRHRSLMSRYATMERMGHPSTYGQGKLIELNAEWLERLSTELGNASPPLAKHDIAAQVNILGAESLLPPTTKRRPKRVNRL